MGGVGAGHAAGVRGGEDCRDDCRRGVAPGALSRSLGVEWAPVAKGTADLGRMSEAIVAEFSTRRAEIAEVAVERDAIGLAAIGAVQR